jgi:hypothetical protein
MFLKITLINLCDKIPLHFHNKILPFALNTVIWSVEKTGYIQYIIQLAIPAFFSSHEVEHRKGIPFPRLSVDTGFHFRVCPWTQDSISASVRGHRIPFPRMSVDTGFNFRVCPWHDDFHCLNVHGSKLPVSTKPEC